MARLNVAVLAACPFPQASTVPIAEQVVAILEDLKDGTLGNSGPGAVYMLRFYFSVHVTDQDLEPVTGLQQDNFTIRHLWIPKGGMVPFDPDIKFKAVPGLPGVYRMSQMHPVSPLTNAFGVSVKKRQPRAKGATTRRRGGGAIVAAKFDTGFGMATAAKDE